MSRYFFSTLVFVLLLGSLLTACQQGDQLFECADAIGCVTIAPDEPIKFGVLYTLSGGSSPGGIEQANTVELAIAQRGNQFLGHPVELQTQDEQCSSEGGTIGALRIIVDPQTIAIFGTNCSGAAVTAGEIMSEAGLVMISGSNSAPSLTSIGGKRGENWYPGYFRTSWNDTVMGRGAATFAYRELGVAKAAIVHGGDAYTQGLADTFQQVFTALGGEIVLEVTIDENEDNHRPLLDAVVLSSAELMYFPLSHPQKSALLVRQAREMEALENLIFIGSEGMISEAFIAAAGPAGTGVYFPGPAAVQSAENDALRATYRARYSEFPPAFYHSFTYDAVNLLLKALTSVAVQEKDGTLYIGRQALRDALYATQDYPGLTGRITCDEFGDCGAAQFNMVRLDDPAAGIEGLRSNVVYIFTPEGKE